MNADLLDHLTDTIYRAAVEPPAWNDVMRLMQSAFRSSAQSFYFLDLAPQRIRPMVVSGVDARWIASFNEAYFAPDNPWFRLTQHLHRPGVVRTNERLAQFARDGDALYRSGYFNEWMRPQRLRYTLGSTMLAERGVVANITLLRPPDMPTFTDSEVAAFERASAHLTRALRIAVRLEQAQGCDAGRAALEAASYGIALVDADARLLHTNARMDAILSGGYGLARDEGRLVARPAALHAQVDALIRGVALDGRARARVALPQARPGRPRLTLRAERATQAGGHYLPGTARVLVTVTEARTQNRPIAAELLQQLYGLTRAEASLAALLVEGRTLQQAADARGIGYGTARGYLKTVFGKVGVHTQAALAMRVITDLAGDGS